MWNVLPDHMERPKSILDSLNVCTFYLLKHLYPTLSDFRKATMGINDHKKHYKQILKQSDAKRAHKNKLKATKLLSAIAF